MPIDRRALIASSAAALGAAAAPALGEGPPVAAVRPVTETLYGTTVTDPYCWMEAEGPEWQAYVAGQGAFARRVLDAIPGRSDLYAAVRGYARGAVAVSGVQTGGDYIFSEAPRPAEPFKLHARKGLAGADPEGFKVRYAMDAYQHVHDGTAYPSCC